MLWELPAALEGYCRGRRGGLPFFALIAVRRSLVSLLFTTLHLHSFI